MAIFCCLVAKEKKTDAIITMSFDFVFPPDDGNKLKREDVDPLVGPDTRQLF